MLQYDTCISVPKLENIFYFCVPFILWTRFQSGSLWSALRSSFHTTIFQTCLQLLTVFTEWEFIAYMPLQCKTTCVGYSRLVWPPTRGVRVADTSISVSKKPCVPNATPYLPNATPSLSNMTPYLPNASQWNMVCVECARVGFSLGMYISWCLLPVPSRWVSNTNPVYSGLWAYNYSSKYA